MKKIKKLIVAILAMAMVIGCFAVQASAAGTKEVIFVLSDATGVKDVYVQMSSNVATAVSEEVDLPCWDGEKALITTSLGNGKYKLTLSVTDTVSKDPNNYCSLKFIAVNADGGLAKGQNVYTQDFADKYNAADTVYISMDMSKNDWSDGSSVTDITTTDPTAIVITAEECEEAIAAIGTVELSEACRGKIDAAKAKINGFKGNTADISNYATYTAAEAKWNELIATGGELKLHIKHEWDSAAVYTYGVNDGELHNAGVWPGTFVVNNAKNTGWTDATITLTSAAHVIINNNAGAQTADIKYMASGEYWITVAADKSYTISKEAPAGWVSSSDAEAADDAEALIDTAIALDATKANKDKYDAALAAYNALSADQKKLVDTAKVEKLNAGVKAIADIIAKEQAEEDAKNAGTLTVYVKSPGWTAMNVYGWDGAEFGSWPGKSLTALKANEGWFSVSFDITKATNLIFNDSKEKDGKQTVDWKEVKAGTYWLVLSETDDKGKYLVDDLSTKAPEGWKEEAAEKIEQELPSTITTVTKEQIDALKDSVKVEGSDDKLVVAPLSATSADVAVITTALSKELKGVKFVAADLKFESNKQPTKDTKITIDVAKFDNIKSAKYVAVYSIDGSKFELVDTVAVKDGKITFTPNHFSTYVFAEASGISAPPAGVSTLVVVAAATLMLAAAVAVIASKKRVEE